MTTPTPEEITLGQRYNDAVSRVETTRRLGHVTDEQWENFRQLNEAVVRSRQAGGNMTLAHAAVEALVTSADALAPAAPTSASAPAGPVSGTPSGGTPNPPAPPAGPTPTQQATATQPQPTPQGGTPAAPPAPAGGNGAPDWFNNWDTTRFTPMVDQVNDHHVVLHGNGTDNPGLIRNVGELQREVRQIRRNGTANGGSSFSWTAAGIAAVIALVVTFLIAWWPGGQVATVALVYAGVVALVVGGIAGALSGAVKRFTARRRQP